MQPSTTQLAILVPALVVALDWIRRIVQTKQDRKGLSLPPGPTQIPLLGNAHLVNIQEPWKTYTDWHAKYGNIVYLRLLDQDIIVLGSQQLAVELLEKRSQIYSDRPFVASIKLYGGNRNFIFTPYGDYWRFCRRIFHQTFRAEAALSFRPMQLHRARQLAKNIADEPDRYLAHFSTFSVAVAMSAAYDYEPSPKHDPMVELIEEYTTISTQAITPERSMLLKFFPFLLHVPDWFPGSSLKREAKHAYSLSEKAAEMPYQYAEKKFRSSGGATAFSMVSDHLSRLQDKDDSQREQHVAALKNAAVSSLLAAEETTTSSLMVFTLAMVLHPRVWKRAQAEIDAVVGKSRAPDFGDKSALPYVGAIIRETLRWRPVVPLGVWHATSSSDVYNDYFIPKGSMVVANAWAISRDESRYPNAEAFVPERFINEDGSLNDDDPAHFTFGFGRRICPGRHTAHASLWCSIATLLATIDFNLSKDAQGKEVSFEPKWLNGLTHRPNMFPCRLSLRAHVDKSYLERMLGN